MTIFSISALVILIMTAAIWTYLSGRFKETLTKPYELLVLKTDKWTPRLNFAASILFLISAFMQIITVAIRLAKTLMN